MKPFELILKGDLTADICILQTVSHYDLEEIEEGIWWIRKGLKEAKKEEISFCFAGVYIENGNDSLSPWKAPPAFRESDPFGSGAEATLETILTKVLPEIRGKTKATRFILGGYSLAGFFALWSGYQTEAFEAVCAVSPSVWFPGWTDYAKEHPIKTANLYLSLGSKESKTRNPMMAPVKECMEETYALAKEQLTESSGEVEASEHILLEWNNGNHYFEVPQRKAKGYVWALKQLGKL